MMLQSQHILPCHALTFLNSEWCSAHGSLCFLPVSQFPSDYSKVTIIKWLTKATMLDFSVYTAKWKELGGGAQLWRWIPTKLCPSQAGSLYFINFSFDLTQQFRPFSEITPKHSPFLLRSLYSTTQLHPEEKTLWMYLHLHVSSQIICFIMILTLKRASLVAQMVKNLPAMQETWVQALGWKDPLEKGIVTHTSILAWRINSMNCYSPCGCKVSDTTEWLTLTCIK